MILTLPLDQLKAAYRALFVREAFSISSVTRTYDDLLNRYVYEALGGRMDEKDFRRTHKALIRTLGREMYTEGLREAGVADADLPDVLQENEATIAGWISEQVSYVDGFARAVIEARGDNNKRRVIISRIKLWVEAIRILGALAKAVGFANRPGTWVLGAAEHCKTCLSLSGKRRRVKWFISKGYWPRSPNLECRGFNCKCRIVGDDGTQLLP